jgi:hypothetical protein
VERLYVYATVASMMLNVVSLCVATFASMLGPDLGLRGPTGGLEVATAELRNVHIWVATSYLLGLYFFMAGLSIAAPAQTPPARSALLCTALHRSHRPLSGA